MYCHVLPMYIIQLCSLERQVYEKERTWNNNNNYQSGDNLSPPPPLLRVSRLFPWNPRLYCITSLTDSWYRQGLYTVHFIITVQFQGTTGTSLLLLLVPRGQFSEEFLPSSSSSVPPTWNMTQVRSQGGHHHQQQQQTVYECVSYPGLWDDISVSISLLFPPPPLPPPA